MRMWYLCLFLITPAVSLFSRNNTLCRPDLCMDSEVHVGCFGRKTLASLCKKGNIILHVNGGLKYGILHRINLLRNYVASGAGNFSVAARMPTILWDYNLQRLADRQVRQCNELGKYCANTAEYHYVATTEIRSTMGRRNSLEHQIYDRMLPELFLDVMGCRMDENKRILPSKEGSCVGHYVPLIQDRGARMGCGIRLKTRTETKSNVILICHFSRANVNNLQPYEVGQHPGEKCVTGSSQLYQFLCNEEETVDANSMVVQTKMPLSAKMQKSNT
ncbi:venom allergen-1 [Drosophila suzukii]|uniref:Venom allergen-1 n=1 Tax=Drosophila suzukii TaxID=28584 RepID=A0AB40A1X3_DROSZ|nr:antigen 5 like allergen Cul n 1 [Drosophila suzukii]